MAEINPAGAEHNSKSRFEQEFDAGKREYDVFGGKIEARVLTPENLTDKVPVVLAPGYGETPEVFKKSAEVVFNSGRSVIMVDHPRRAGVFDKETLSQISEENGIPMHELRKAATLLHIFDEEGIEQADAIAHSEAAINVALAETLAPGIFRDVVFSNPAALIGKDEPLKLIARNTRKDARNVLETIKGNIGIKTEGRALKEGLKYILKNLIRSLGEVREISQSQLEDTLKDLHDQGMGIAVMAGVDDRTFTMDRIQKIVKSDQISTGITESDPDFPDDPLKANFHWEQTENPVGFVDGFASVRGGHDDLHASPDQYTGAALGLLTALNEKRRASREAEAAAPTDTPPESVWQKLQSKRFQKGITPSNRRRIVVETQRREEEKIAPPEWGWENVK
jgi:hypothetical protein